MEHERERQGEAPEQRKIEKIRREQRCRAEQQRCALTRDERGKGVISKTHEHDESKARERDGSGEHEESRRHFGPVDTVKLRADLIRIACQAEGFRRRGGLVHAVRYQRVALVAEVGQKLVLDERPRLFPPQLLSRGVGKLGKGFRQSQGRRLLSARDRPQW